MRPAGGVKKITLNEESEEFAWFEPSQIDRLDVTKNTSLIFKKFAETQTVKRQS
jgi:hypothetical protein